MASRRLLARDHSKTDGRQRPRLRIGLQTRGSADLKTDPLPFWEAVVRFDANGDDRLERKEMTGHFTFPFRPQLPPGHPGYGLLPLPKDPSKRKKKLDGMFFWMDKDKDGFWDKKEFLDNLTIGRGKPLLVAVRPGGKGGVMDTHVEWEFNKGIPEVPSPILHEKLIYMISNGGVLTCVDGQRGKWSTARGWKEGASTHGLPLNRRKPFDPRIRGRVDLHSWSPEMNSGFSANSSWARAFR